MLLFRLQGTRNIIVLKRRQQQQQKKKTRNSIVLYQDFYFGKTKRELHDRKTEHYQGNHQKRSFISYWTIGLLIEEHITSTGHSFKWHHFDILARWKSDTHCKIKENVLIRDSKPALNENISKGKLYLH